VRFETPFASIEVIVGKKCSGKTSVWTAIHPLSLAVFEAIKHKTYIQYETTTLVSSLPVNMQQSRQVHPYGLQRLEMGRLMFESAKATSQFGGRAC